MADNATPDDFIEIDLPLVARLIAAQFPEWADLPVAPVAFGGWDNRTFHLGHEMTVRLPSAARYAPQVEKEQRWLPYLAPLLPLAIPVPLAMGKPTDAYPWHWSIYRWLNGEAASLAPIADCRQPATALAGFLATLQRINADDGPPPGSHNFFRGGPLAVYDGETRQAIAALGDRIDVAAATDLWETALAASWHGRPVWLHGDISAGNLLVDHGRLAAVIDFGCCAVGDPACDLSIAWTFFDEDSRNIFRTALPLDEPTWARGRGWTLWKALITLAALPGTDHAETEKSRRVLDAVLADHQSSR